MHQLKKEIRKTKRLAVGKMAFEKKRRKARAGPNGIPTETFKTSTTNKKTKATNYWRRVDGRSWKFGITNPRIV